MGGDMDPDVLRELADVKEAIKQGNFGESNRDGYGSRLTETLAKCVRRGSP